MRVKWNRKVSKEEGVGLCPRFASPVSPAAPLTSSCQADVTAATTGDKDRVSFDHLFPLTQDMCTVKS